MALQKIITRNISKMTNNIKGNTEETQEEFKHQKEKPSSDTKEEAFFVAFDTETTGAYPMKWEICEIAGVKWKDGQVIDEFSQLVRPRGPMHPVAYQVHRISATQLNSQPYIEEVLPQFLNFIGDATLIAHHAPFDMGFIAYDLEERCQHKLPTNKVICTSLLSRSLFPEFPNHKLQTLIEYFKLKKQQPSHRSLNDSHACLLVALECFKKIHPLTMDAINDYMNVPLMWDYFSLKHIQAKPEMKLLMNAVLDQRQIHFVYHRGSRPGVSRKVLPIGLVRNPTGDFFVAEDQFSDNAKRFYLNFVSNVHLAR